MVALENDRSKLMVLYHAATCPYEGVPGYSKTTNTDRSTGGIGSQDGSRASSDNTFSATCCPTHPHCCAAKRLFGHMITCVRANMCDVPGCQHARSVWKHYRKCPHRIIAQCGLCNAVPQAYSSKTLCERFRASNGSNGARTMKNYLTGSTGGSGSGSGSGGGGDGRNSRGSYSQTSSRNNQQQHQQRRQFTTPTFQVDRNQNVQDAGDGRQHLQYYQHQQHYHQTDEGGQLYSSDMLFQQGDEKIVGMWPAEHRSGSANGNDGTPLGSASNSNRLAGSRIVTPDSTTDDHNNSYGRDSYQRTGNEKQMQTVVFGGERLVDGGKNQHNNQRSWRIQKSRISSIASRGEYYAVDSAAAPQDEQEERARYDHEKSLPSSTAPSTGKQRGRNFLAKMNPRSSRRDANFAKDPYAAQETDQRNSSYQEEYSSSNQQHESRMRGPLRRFAV